MLSKPSPKIATTPKLGYFEVKCDVRIGWNKNIGICKYDIIFEGLCTDKCSKCKVSFCYYRRQNYILRDALPAMSRKLVAAKTADFKFAKHSDILEKVHSLHSFSIGTDTEDYISDELKFFVEKHIVWKCFYKFESGCWNRTEWDWGGNQMSISLCELDEIEECRKFCFATGGKFYVTNKVIKPWIETGPSTIASSYNIKEKVKNYAHVLLSSFASTYHFVIQLFF